MNSSPIAAEKALIPAFLSFVDQLGDRLDANVPQIVDVDRLQQLSEGTFGRSVADFLQQNELQPFTTGPRRKQLHDCVHVLTGYGTDPIGELEVQAFLLGAKFHPVQLVLAAGLLRIAHRRAIPFPLTRPTIRRRLRMAYQRGQVSRFDVDTWQPETLWQRPLIQVQTMFRV
jgi:ubiquinone biosynthesis protein Coq4